MTQASCPWRRWYPGAVSTAPGRVTGPKTSRSRGALQTQQCGRCSPAGRSTRPSGTLPMHDSCVSALPLVGLAEQVTGGWPARLRR